MREEIERIVEAHWQGRLPALLGTLADAQRQVDALLASHEDQRGDGTGGERLERSLGEFGTEAMDLEALSGILRQTGAGDQTERRTRRLQRLAAEIAAAQRRMEREPPRPSLRGLGTEPEEVLRAFEAHVAPMCEALRLVRQARLEVRGLYDAAEHDPLFAQFTWRQLDSVEMALCPPFVLFTEPPPDGGTWLAALLELVTSGRPLKVVLLHGSWHADRAETGRAAPVRGLENVTLLFLALRHLFFVQTSTASPTPMAERIGQGLESPRPAMLSVFAHGGDREDVSRDAAAALASRGFPHVLYDPERAPDFVSCLDLSDNPDPSAQWVTRPLTFVDEGEVRRELDRPFTFADYACAEPELRGQFTALRTEQEARAVPLAAYLDLEPDERRTRVPFVYTLAPDQRLARLVPSQTMLAYTSDRTHLWMTLRELSGIGNPFVLAAEHRLREQLTAEKEAALGEQKIRLEAESRVRERARLKEAVSNLVTYLTGITVAPGTVSAREAPLEAARTTVSPEAGPNVLSGGPAAPASAAAGPDATGEPPSDADTE